MAGESINNQTESIPIQKGGKREGAGRPRRSPEEVGRWMTARGIDPLHASEILSRVVDERKVWKRIFDCPDERVVLQAMMFLVSMRDGRPAQQINVTSLGVNISASDIASARAIVREITGSPSVRPQTESERGEGSPSLHGEGKANPIQPLMLQGDEGGKKDG